MKVGVLSIQGAYKEHIHMLNNLNVKSIEVRSKYDLSIIDGLIIPGGESTCIGKLLYSLDIYDELKDKIKNGFPVWGTCAGMIVLANHIENQSDIYLSVIDITVVRNGYGRQLSSFNTISGIKYIGKDLPMIFIRAPYIKTVGSGVEILAIVDNKIVAAKENNILVTSFHPELTNDLRVHQYFLQIIKNSIL